MGSLKIRKRNGRIVDFTKTKITIAISKAMDAVGQTSLPKAERITEDVVADIKKEYFSKKVTPSVENVQDLVEKHLILHRLPEVAKAYILYRDLHSRIRNIENLVDIAKLTNDYIDRKDWEVNSNSSIDYSLPGLNNYIYSEVGKVYWLNQIFTNEMKELHQSGDIKINKLQAISPYCIGWDLLDLITVGFGGVPGFLQCSPPKHFSTALGQLCNFMYTTTQEAPEGAIAVANFDTLLAPFVHFDKLTHKQVKQKLQEYIFDMNVPTKVGGQVPFTNISLDLTCPKYFADQNVIIGGKPQKTKYGDYQKEMDMINAAFAEVMMEGDASGRVFSFPIPTYNITKDFNWENPVYEPIWEMTAKYGIPYFANFVNSDMKPEDARSMCCRLRIDNRELHRRGGGLFGANPLTGSIGYVTINFPRLGHLFKGRSEKELFERLDYLIQVSSDCLQLRRETLESLTEKGFFPYSKFYLRNLKKKTKKYWDHHFNTIGVIGINECCLNYLDKDLTSQEGQAFAKRILDHCNDLLIKLQEKTGQLYNLEAIPGESTGYQLAKLDKRLYPDIRVANEEDYRKGAEPYYTNSTHLPVGFTDDLFEAMDKQDELQSKYTGGTVFHVFLGERLTSGVDAARLVKTIASRYKMPYFTLTPTFSICASHGYLSGEHWSCPKCQKECEVYSRIVGKIHPVQRWNPGKKEEFKDRKTYQYGKA
ncbi:MAG: ribonucleoside triphosphate reductase [Candidatus Dojkabacteria bacterium]|nr:ribonucleoside triphosphate reductase [Candidatus Dojkabacteria bacterium]